MHRGLRRRANSLISTVKFVWIVILWRRLRTYDKAASWRNVVA